MMINETTPIHEIPPRLPIYTGSFAMPIMVPEALGFSYVAMLEYEDGCRALRARSLAEIEV